MSEMGTPTLAVCARQPLWTGDPQQGGSPAHPVVTAVHQAVPEWLLRWTGHQRDLVAARC